MLIQAVFALAVAGAPSTTGSVSAPMAVRVRVEATCTVAPRAATGCRGALGAAPLADRVETGPGGERRRLVTY